MKNELILSVETSDDEWVEIFSQPQLHKIRILENGKFVKIH